MHTTAIGGTLKERVARILQDPEMREQLARLSPEQVGYLSPMRAAVGPEEFRDFVEGYSAEAAPPGINELETIVLRYGRPVYLVRGDGFEPPPSPDPQSEVWRERLEAARRQLAAAIRASG